MIKYLFIPLLLFILSTTVWAQALTPYFNYTVTETDKNLWSISQKHGVLLTDLKILNQKTDDKVQLGELLKIPKQTPKNEDYIIHKVEKKDKNLYRIGMRYKVTVEELMLLNNKKNTLIRAGEELKIPKNGKYIIHIVSETDKSLWGICQIYGIEVDEVKKANHKKNNTIRRGDRLAIPKQQQIRSSMDTKEEVPPINGDDQGLKAAYDFKANKWRFPYHNRRDLHIFPSIKTGFSNYYQLSPVEYAAFFQNSKDYAPNKEQKVRYFYSIEEAFVKSLDGKKARYLSLPEKDFLDVQDGYSYDFITLIEVDSIDNSFKILPVFLVKDSYGKMIGTVEKGSFACCADPFPLATYHHTGDKETTSYSRLLTPSVIKYTEVVNTLKHGEIIQQDSTISILQLKTDGVPELIDYQEYSNRKKIRSFSNNKRRQELGY